MTLGETLPPLTFTLTNDGGSPSGILGAQLTDDQSFSVTGGTCVGATVGPAATCTVLVAFHPSGTAGARPAALSIVDGKATMTATLTGVGLTPGKLTLAPASHDFGRIAVGSTSPEVQFTLKNTGEAATGTLSADLTDPTNFAISTNGCPSTLAAGASCSVGVRFAPKSVGIKQGVSLTDSASPGGTAAATLGGTGAGKLTVTKTGSGTGSVVSSPAGIDCGATCTTSFSAGSVTLTATADPLSDFVSWSGGGCGGSGTCKASLAGATTTVTATFALRPAALSVTPAAQDFGAVISGAAGLPVTFNVTNLGGDTSGSIGATVDDGTDYTVTGGTCLGQGLTGAASCTVLVQFNPTSAGSKPATLTVSGSPGGSVTSTLTGTGDPKPAALSLAPASQDFGSVTIGSTASATFTVSNPGDQTSGAIAASVDDTTDYTVTGGTCIGQALAGAATCTVTVRFKPAASATRPGMLTVSASPGGSAIAALTGTGTPKPAALSAAPASQDFGGVTLGGSTPITFTVTNTGGVATGTIAASVSDTTNYTMTGGTCIGHTLAGAANCTVVVQFNPSSSGSKPATLSVSASPGGTTTSALSGTGLSVSFLTVTPASWTSAQTTVGSTSVEQLFTIRNNGQSPSGVPGAPTLSDSTTFTISSNTCTAALPANGMCTFGVKFKPATAGLVQMKTVTVSASPGGSVVSTLTGTGAAQLTVANAVGGTVTSNLPGINCASGVTCTATFTQSPVVLTATADGTHAFTGWSGGGCAGAGTCSVPLNVATTTVATSYLARPTVTITNAIIDAKNATAQFQFTVSSGTPVCKLDSGAEGSCTSPWPFSDLRPGSHTFTVSSTNAAGTGTASYTWSSDAWVDGVNGLDTNIGNINHPLQRITNGLATGAKTVWVNPGRYATETFPLIVGGAALIGDVATRGTGSNPTMIQGSAQFFGVQITMFLGSGAVVKGFDIYPSATADAAIYAGGTNIQISSNRFNTCNEFGQRCADGIEVVDTTNVVITDNYMLARQSYSGPGRGMYFENSTGMVESCYVAGWPVANVSIVGTAIDLGGGGQSSGGNSFQCGATSDVSSSVGGQTIFARNNLWDHDPPTSAASCSGRVDFCSPNDVPDFGTVAGTSGGCP